MELGTKAELLGATALPYEEVPVSALKRKFIVVGMSGKDRDGFEASLVAGTGKRRQVKTDNIRARLAARCIYTAAPTEGGVRMFTDAEADALGDVRADVLSPLFDVAQRLSGVSDDDIEELEKKSSAGPTT